MIIVDNVYKKYYSKNRIAYPALNGATLTAKEGELTAILGASGAGKSTLLHILSCIDTYDSGSVKVDDIELKSLDEDASAEYRNTQIGIVLQNFALIPDFNVYENIVLPLRFSQKHIPKKKMQEMVENVSEQLGIKNLIFKKISELSGGEKQRVAVARALINSPKYIFADEPTGALDSQNTFNIVEIFRKISRNGVGVIIVTHDKSVSSKCDVVWEMKDGKVL